MTYKDTAEEIIGVDVHMVTQNGEKVTLSYFDFVNMKNFSVGLSKNDYKPLRNINLNIECDGYQSTLQYFDN